MNRLSPVISDSLESIPGISHAFFTRQGGVSSGLYEGLNAGLGSGDNRQHVLENRRRMTAHLGVGDEKMASPYQIHSADVVVTDRAWDDDRPKADGVVTTRSGLAIGVVTADCGPVLFADAKNGVVGACHAGWKGAVGGILEETVDAMVAQGANQTSITAVLGPTISQHNYEVGPEFPDQFLFRSSRNVDYFTPSARQGYWMFDLSGYIVDRLKATGVDASCVQRCTYAEQDNFYSYRRTTHQREPDYGRQLSAIVLK
ncbi:MAG: peptidoglycan editing factor PgeF [Rhizobiaceae bacterium]